MHAGGVRFQLDASFPETGVDTVTVNFDETHLESLLTRLRQFFCNRELFYYKDIRSAIIELFGMDTKFQRFYDRLVETIKRPLPSLPLQAFKGNGRDAVTGFSFKKLMEAQLYTGPLHSERIIDADPGSAEEGLPSSHDATKKHLVLVLAYGAMSCVNNICAMRNWALRRAREAGRVDLFPELKKFDDRSRKASV